ncbi:hypothetical protein ACU686_09995 [Yinghuangia aomiensis]
MVPAGAGRVRLALTPRARSGRRTLEMEVRRPEAPAPDPDPYGNRHRPALFRLPVLLREIDAARPDRPRRGGRDPRDPEATLAPPRADRPGARASAPSERCGRPCPPVCCSRSPTLATLHAVTVIDPGRDRRTPATGSPGSSPRPPRCS